MKKTPLKRKTRLKPMGEKMQAQKIREKILAVKLFEKQKGLCARCHKPLMGGWFHKHEIVRRSAGGDATDEKNCELLCVSCHREVTEYVNPDDKGVHR